MRLHMRPPAPSCAHAPAQVCDTVAEMGAELAEESAPGATQWPELLPFMFQCVQSGQPKFMESGGQQEGGGWRSAARPAAH